VSATASSFGSLCNVGCVSSLGGAYRHWRLWRLAQGLSAGRTGRGGLACGDRAGKRRCRADRPRRDGDRDPDRTARCLCIADRCGRGGYSA
jgi:hypothetical protein